MWKSITHVFAPTLSLTVVMLCLLSTTSSLLAQVSLVSVSPPNGTTNFDVTQPVEFTFSEEMLNILPFNFPGFTSYLQWTSLGSISIDYAWDDTLTVLTCTFPDNLPGETTIGWTLNPPGALMLLTTAMGEPLSTTSGSFTTGAGQTPCDPDGIPEEFGSITLAKAVTYIQTSPAAPELSTEAPPAFGIYIQSRAMDSITSAYFQAPGGSEQPVSSIIPSFYVHSEEFDTVAELDTAYPAGNYTINLQEAGAGNSSVAMVMPATPPSIPQIANFNATQNVDPDTPFTLVWNEFTGGGTLDIIELMITDGLGNTVFEAPDLCANIELPSTATSITIPADTFASDKVYNCQLGFYLGFYQSDTAINEYVTFGALGNTTEFTLRTGGGVVAAKPDISHTILGTDGSITFTTTNLQPGITYAVETSDTADGNVWSELSTFTAGSTEETLTDPVNTSGNRFYRVVAR